MHISTEINITEVGGAYCQTTCAAVKPLRPLLPFQSPIVQSSNLRIPFYSETCPMHAWGGLEVKEGSLSLLPPSPAYWIGAAAAVLKSSRMGEFHLRFISIISHLNIGFIIMVFPFYFEDLLRVT